jgi:hypothetical protein
MNEYDPDFIFLWYLENKQNIINRYLAPKLPSNNTTQKKLNEWITCSNMKQLHYNLTLA